MPVNYLRGLTGRERSVATNERLAYWLAFIAGATNAGGYLAVQQYTSHMTGIVSTMADSLALHQLTTVLAGFVALVSFLAGAACSAVMVNWGRRRSHYSQFALPLVLEAVLLIVFGFTGNHLEQRHWLFVPVTVNLLCFTMGLQNAMITKISRSEIRTTHVTGMVTDIGIELGKWIYWNRSERLDPVRPNFHKLWLLCALVSLFFAGGVSGALGFKHVGFVSTLPLAGALLVLAVVPVMDDLRGARK